MAKIELPILLFLKNSIALYERISSNDADHEILPFSLKFAKCFYSNLYLPNLYVFMVSSQIEKISKAHHNSPFHCASNRFFTEV